MNGLLSAQDTVANTSLQQLIQEVTAVVVGNEVPAGGSVFVHSELHKGAQLLSLFPMPAEAGPLSAIAHGARAIVFILEWDDMGSPPAAQLADYFGLTRAEARLAAALAKGASLEDCTVRFGISKNTVRSQIRAIFDKTGASRQGDLIARILRSPAGRCSSLLIGLEDQ
jgi:DNA-binding CsgD family transcriptional regulator